MQSLPMFIPAPTPLIFDPHKATNPELVQAIQQLGFKPSSGLKKDDLITFYHGAVRMRQEGIAETNSKKSITLNLLAVQPDPTLELMPHILKYGWAVADIPNFNSVEIRNDFLQWLHRICDQFNPEDPNTWTKENIPYNLHGIFKQYIGHTEFLWKTREACIPIFEQIWGTHDLLTSFDGGCFLTHRYSSNYKQWMHCDQGRKATHFACVQGIVNLYDNGSEDGGTVLMNCSASKHAEYLAAHPIDGISAFFPIDPADPILKDCTIIKPCLNAGQILLFDSRTFHCNIAPTSRGTAGPNGTPLRMCLYVSMMPTSYAAAADRQKRIKLAQEGRMTGHWCYGPFFSACGKEVNPMYTKGTPKVTFVEIAELNPVRRKLIGYPE